MGSAKKWPQGVDVLVLPGFPDRDIEDIEGKKVYPSDAIDVVKVLRGMGLTVEYTVPKPSRAIVSLKASDLWIPVLLVLQGVFINWGTSDLRDAFLLWRGRTAPKALHVKMGVLTEKGREVRWVQASGDPDAVISTIEIFQASLVQDQEENGSN
jgi:hypothetical protein